MIHPRDMLDKQSNTDRMLAVRGNDSANRGEALHLAVFIKNLRIIEARASWRRDRNLRIIEYRAS